MIEYSSDDEGKIRLSDDFRRRRVRLKYPELFPIKLNPQDMSLLKKRLSDVDFQRGVVVCCESDWMRPVFLYGLLKIGLSVTFTLMNGYYLLDIMLGKVEEISAISQIEHKVVALYLGYAEMENKRQSDVIEQLIGLASARGPIRQEHEMGVSSIEGQAVWLYYKGKLSAFQAKYPNLVRMTGELGFSLVDFGGPRKLEAVDEVI